MRVLWASHSGRIGGAELCLLEGAAAVQSLGAEVLAVLPEDAALGERLRGAGVGVATAPLSFWAQSSETRFRPARAAKPLVHLWNAWRLRRLVGEFAPDVVVTNTVVFPDAALAARMAGAPHVWYIHEYGDRDHQLRFNLGRARSLRAVAALSDRVVVNSPALARHFGPDLRPTPVDLVDYAVETPGAVEGPLPPRRSAFEAVLVGARHPGKRQEDAVRALAALRGRGVDAALTLVGPSWPDYEARLRRLVADEGVADHVAFVDHTDNPHAFVAAADVALMCSENEAFGRVTVEAMKLGRPVVGAASGGTVDLVEDGVTGLHYRPTDAVDLADKLERLARDPAARERMGRAGREAATARFSAGRYGRELLRTFRLAADR